MQEAAAALGYSVQIWLESMLRFVTCATSDIFAADPERELRAAAVLQV